ncbi:glycosyltransferase family 4 protein [uncultured Legionella sp.]|uniref:glycosyltransferase family 4 protein n=1 Tax=uncultured Legionella sp. TaxID=210934 RepID=UPI00262EC642|nr:glycosyltransferase family 4 protein [uncultured Legionella sp.]
MKIMNAMFSTVNGGIEQVFLTYNHVLESLGHELIPVIHPWGQVRKNCTSKKSTTIFNYGSNDFIAIHRLRKLIEKENPSCIITHTKRDARLFYKTQTQVPKIAVCHTVESFAELITISDAVIVITEHMYQEVRQMNWAGKKVFTVPNMIHIPADLHYKEPVITSVPVIGACARFSDLKGIDVFINALAILTLKGINFTAKIAGNGKQKKQYIKLIKQHGLQHNVTLMGWVNDKHSFYESLDVFCHPTLKESFGLVVVESMMHSIPMVLTQVSGPLEIIGESGCAVLVPPSDVIGLANGLERLLGDLGLAKELAHKGYQRVQYYSCQAVGSLLDKALDEMSH